jgi:hypothetical protein
VGLAGHTTGAHDYRLSTDTKESVEDYLRYGSIKSMMSVAQRSFRNFPFNLTSLPLIDNILQFTSNKCDLDLVT